MSEQLTFSSLVDSVLAATGRQDRLQSIVGFARATIRECQLKGTPSFIRDIVEVEVQPTTTPFIWDRPKGLRGLRTAVYGLTSEIYDPIYPELIRPGRKQANKTEYYYESGESFVFAGVDITQTVALAYYSYAPHFVYYKDVADRPATYDEETDVWTYHSSIEATEEAQLVAREKVQHWLLLDWFELIKQGTLGKTFQLNGDERSRPAFALLKSMQSDLIRAERQVATGE